MSRAAYERVRKALEGTPLDGQIERLCAELHLTPESDEWVIAALTVVASSRLEQSLERADGMVDELPNRIEAVLRTQAEPLARTMASTIGPAVVASLKSEISANLAAQHDVAMQAHESARRSISNLETAVAGKVDRIATKAISTMQQHSVLYPLAVIVVALVLLAWNWHGPFSIGYAAGSKHGFSDGYRSGVIAQYHWDVHEYEHFRARWDARVSTSGVK